MSTTAISRSASGPAHRKARRTPRAGRTALRALSTIVTALVSVFAAVMILAAVASHLSPNGQFTVFGHPVMTMLSGSMSPVIRTGDMIVDDPVTAVQAQHLQPGQVVSFREAAGSTAVITHRIVAVRHGAGGQVSYVTKGDANNAADSPARPASDVVGVFSHDIPRAGYLLTDLHRPAVLGLLAASIALFFTAGPLIRYARKQSSS